MSLHPDLRKIIDNLIMFTLDKVQQEKVYEEKIKCKKSDFEEINKICFDKPYQWLFINPNEQRIFKEFDEMMIIEDED